MRAPESSPYKGYLFQFEINFPEDYPNSPPIVFCKTNMHHMNINTDGKVCVDSVNDDWGKDKNISTVLLSIFIILLIEMKLLNYIMIIKKNMKKKLKNIVKNMLLKFELLYKLLIYKLLNNY